jgi:pimeloyl-ACP methyl ester carboxylesterase
MLKLQKSFSSIFLMLLLSFAFIKEGYSQATIPYGDNKEVGKYIMLNGVRHYYEAYGRGRPLLLIHGNSTGTKGWAAQIEFFSKKYCVYSVDCRGRGKSDLGKDSLSFEQTANDMAAFIKALNLDSIYVLGKSDGAIVAILMGIYHPMHISKIVAFAGNMQPDSTALYPEVVADISEERKSAERMFAGNDTAKKWKVEQQRLRLDEFQPHITAQDLQKIGIPVLVMSCDRDVIKLEHSFWIYKNIPLANLCILPGETHHVPRNNPVLFNEVVNGFLSRPFKEDATRFGD